MMDAAFEFMKREQADMERKRRGPLGLDAEA